jgi:hypothetical protein
MSYSDRFDINSHNFRRSRDGVFPATPDVTSRNFALPGESIHNPIEFTFPVGSGEATASEAIARSRIVLGTVEDIDDAARRDAILAVVNEDPDYFNAIHNGYELSGFGIGIDGLEQDDDFEANDEDHGSDAIRDSDYGNDQIYAEANGLGSCIALDTIYTGTKATGKRLSDRLAKAAHQRRYHDIEFVLTTAGTVRQRRKPAKRRAKAKAYAAR